MRPIVVTICLLILSCKTQSLRLTKSTKHAHLADCKEVLTQNLECPSVGSYPVAGACDYFALCMQTNNGVEATVDFCPDGNIYLVNRCVKSQNINDCPQKNCALKPATISFPSTTTTPFFPTPITTSPTTIRIPTSTKRPTTPNIVLFDPGRNQALQINSNPPYLIIAPIILLLKIQSIIFSANIS